MSCLTPHEALHLTATFAFTADYVRATDIGARARIYEIASRVALLRASIPARHGDARPQVGIIARRSVFATA